MNKRSQAVLAVSVGLFVGACGSDGTQPMSGQPKSDPSQALSQSNPQPQSKGTSKQPVVVPSTIPLDAKYTLYTMRFSGPGHIQEGKLFRDKIVQSTGRTDWLLIHEDQQSVLYYGYYREISPIVDPVDGSRCQTDRKWLESIKDPVTGHRQFVGVMTQPLPSADPPAPAEWNLSLIDKDKDPRDPNRQYWSLVVAGYTTDAIGANKENRKQLAVDTVREMRNAGIQAFFYHGPTVSQVCVGTWKRSAITEQADDKVSSQNEHDDIVVSPVQLSPASQHEIESQKEGTKVFSPRVEVLDATLAQTLNDERFRYYALNGELQPNKITDPRTGTVTVRKQPSFIVEIPRLQPSLLSGGTEPTETPMNPQSPGVINPLAPRAGQLRSIGQ